MRKLLLLSFFLCAIPLYGQNNARMLSTPNAQTGTSYLFVAADTTRVVSFNNALPVAATLPNGASAGFGPGIMLSLVNLGAGAVTITCSACTINGSATLLLSQNQGADIYGGAGSPAVNYIALPSPAGANIALQGGNNAFTGNNTFVNINNTLYVSQFAGADLGAKMNAAVTNCTTTLGLTACKYIIDIGGTISTPPVFPMGSVIECTATGTITLATTWTFPHRNVTFAANGCDFAYNQDSGSAAIIVGKNATGTVNTSGTGPSTVTYVSGTNFANLDVGDLVAINGAYYNVSAVSPPNSFTTPGNTGTQTGVNYAVNIGSPNLSGSYPASATIRELNLRYTGAGTTTSIGIQLKRAFNVNIVNPKIRDFTGSQSVAFQINGGDDNRIDNPWFYNNKCQVLLDQDTSAGLTITSNQNYFYLPTIEAGGACASTAAVNVTNNGFGNVFWMPDMESNATTYSSLFQNGAFGNKVLYGDFEVNGDNTAGSYDIAFASGIENLAEGNRFTSLATNKPAAGMLCTGATTFCTFKNNYLDAVNNHYSTAWNFSSGATGLIIGNNPQGTAHDDPVNSQDIAGNYTLATITSTGFIRPSVAGGADLGQTLLPWGNLWLGTAATNNFKFAPAATAAARTITVPDPGGNDTMAFLAATQTFANKTLTSPALTTPTVGGGTTLTKYSRFSVSLSPALVAANTCAAQSFTVTGIAAADILIAVSKPTEQAGLSVTLGHVTGANTATVNFCNNTAAGITPTATETYQFVTVQ